MMTTHTTSRPGGAPTPSVVEQQDGRATASCDRPVTITTTRTEYFAAHKIYIGGEFVGEVAEAFGVPSDRMPFLASAFGVIEPLGWHRTRDEAVAVIVAVYDAVQRGTR